MRIVHFNDVVYGYASKDPSANGGAERYAWLLLRALASRGWVVTVGVSKGLEYQRRISISGVHFVGIGKVNKFNQLMVWYRFLRTEKPNWWFWQCADVWLGPGVSLAKLLSIRTIFSIMHDRHVDPRVLYQRPHLWFLYAVGLVGVDRIFIQHQGQRTQLSSRLKKKSSFLPGIVESVLSVIPHSQRSRVVAWVGVLRPLKRVDLLIAIARQAPNIHFVVCGGPTMFLSPPDYGKSMTTALQSVSNIDHLGQVDPDRTLQVIAEASLLLSTSDEEGYPSVFLEAWSAGTPVVSLTVDPDTVIQQKGLGVITGDVERTVKEITRLLDSPEEREKMACRAQEHIKLAHNEDAAVQAFESAVYMHRSHYVTNNKSQRKM